MAGEDLPNGTAMQADDAWIEGVLDRLPAVPVDPALEARILASFDDVTARRGRSIGYALYRLAARFRDAVWPGVPAWQPAAVLAASLLIGVGVGTYIPFEDLALDSAEQTASVAFDTLPSFDLGETS